MRSDHYSAKKKRGNLISISRQRKRINILRENRRYLKEGAQTQDQKNAIE